MLIALLPCALLALPFRPTCILNSCFFHRSRSVPRKPYEKLLPSILGNYYGNLFGNARDVAVSVHRCIEYLRGATRAYVDALYGSTIPPNLLDSAAGRLAVMRSPTMW